MSDSHVGTRELKNKLSEYLRRVKAGEMITVTEHGKPIGTIVPIKPTLQEKMKNLLTAGKADWNGCKVCGYKASAVNYSKQTLSGLIVEDRE